VSGQRHALSNLLPVTLGPGTRELIPVPVELCWFRIVIKMLEASLADLIRVHYSAQYFAANTVVIVIIIIITAAVAVAAAAAATTITTTTITT